MKELKAGIAESFINTATEILNTLYKQGKQIKIKTPD